MDRNQKENFATPRFTYGAVESALAAAFDANATQAGALRGRIGHLRRLGLPGIKPPGKGARVRYSLAQGSQWLLAMLMNEIGIDPVIAVSAIEKVWPNLQRWFERSLDGEAFRGNPVWLTLRPTPLIGWTKSPEVDWIGAFRWKDARSKKQPYMLLNAVDDDEWLCTRNLTRMMSKFVDALKSEE
jgi:hypothetical protein